MILIIKYDNQSMQARLRSAFGRDSYRRRLEEAAIAFVDDKRRREHAAQTL
jgi:hypothetical protein